MAVANENWSGRLGFILATVGSAVGLGSIWKFPYEVGANGGGGFVLFYLAGLVLIVTPLMLAEFTIGRRGKSDARASIAAVARAHGASPQWAMAGTLGVATAFLILSFYSVIGGWALAYAVETVWAGLPGTSAAAAQDHFNALLASPERMTAYHTCFMLITAIIVARGIAGGIEEASKILMPALVILMVALAAYSMIEGDIATTLRYLFTFNPEKMTVRVALEALGLGFFSIGVGLAVMITYAAYAGPEINLREAAFIAIASDTAISFLAGFIVFPIIFANKLDPSSGPGLIFVTLPLAFSAMPMGVLFAVSFFVLLFIAAIASAISMLQMPVAFAQQTLGWSRKKSVAVAGIACWLTGLGSVFSFNLWANWFPLAAIPIFKTATFFDLLDHLTSNLLLPAGGLALALFTGWALPKQILAEELDLEPTALEMMWTALRYVVPFGIAAATILPFLI